MNLFPTVEACIETVNRSHEVAMRDLAERFMEDYLQPFLKAHKLTYILCNRNGISLYCEKTETHILKDDLRKACMNTPSCVDDVPTLRGQYESIAEALDLLLAASAETDEQGKKLYEWLYGWKCVAD